MKYKAVMMDFDGTLTSKGRVFPSKKMAQKLIELAEKMPIAICTGRQLQSFIKRGISVILELIPESERKNILSNIFLIAENGSVGYFFNSKTNRYQEFYKSKWPTEFISKKHLRKMLEEKISKFGELLNEHKIIIVMRAYRLDKTPVREIYKSSTEMFKICDGLLRKYHKNYEKCLHLGDSGIGVIVCPADGDKDMGTRKFAEYLAEKRGMKFDKKLREILVIGDSAKKGGNDFYFLQGEYGTPFTVGFYNPKTVYPLPVINAKGKRLLYSKGTYYLLEHNF